MADYHLGRDEQELGVFPEHEIREGLLTGRFLPTDLAWMAGMTDWQPLESLPAFSPPQPETMPPEMNQAAPEAQYGPPFEDRDTVGFFTALFTTISLVLTQPRDTFSSMRRDGGFGTPLFFLLAVGWPMVILSTTLFSDGSLRMLGEYDFSGQSFDRVLGGPGFFEIAYLMGYPFMVVFGQFLGAAITHACLLAVGGANHSYETTFRVSCYTTGAASVFQLLPILGPLLILLWGGIIQVVGLAAAHGTGLGRVVLALVIPMLVLVTIVLGGVFGLSGSLFQ
jgi:hypothetical protein